MRWNSEQTRSYQHPNQAPQETQTTWGKVFGTADALSDLAMGLLMTSGRLRPVDYAALGMKAFHAGVKLKNIWAVREPKSLHNYFVNSEWLLCPFFVSKMAFGGMEIQEKMVEDQVDSLDGKVLQAVYTAKVDDVEIAWISPPSQDSVPDYIFSKTPEKLREIAARRLWERAGPDRIIRIKGEQVVPHYLPTDVIETAFLRSVEMRARRFLDRNIPRAMILDGEPGMGKTTAAGHLVRKLKFKAVVINAVDLTEMVRDRDGTSSRGVELAELLRPDVLIVNDIERVNEHQQVRLLDIFDNAKAYSKIIFATTNHYRSLLEPIRRPGRLDDLIHVPGLSLEEIHHIAPDMKRVAEKMIGWPVAYVRDMQERFEGLGEEAFSELAEVQKRLDEVRADGQYDKKRRKRYASDEITKTATLSKVDPSLERELKQALANPSFVEGLVIEE